MKKALVIMLALAGALTAQNWNVKLIKPPPQNVFFENLWHCRITNNEKEPVEVTLTGWVTESGKEVARGTSNPITIPPGGKMITSADITGGTWDYDPKYEPFAMQRRPLPPGFYVFCIKVDRAEDKKELAQDCEDFSIESKVSPPRLITPKNRATIMEAYPTYVWTSCIPPPAGVTYTIRIAEIQEGETPEQALEDSRPLVEKPDIRTTTFTYPASAAPLEKDKEYAWQVTAMVEREEIGKSKVWSFVLPSDAITPAQQIFKTNLPRMAVQAFSSAEPINGFTVSGPDSSGYVYLTAHSNAGFAPILKNFYPHTAFQEFKLTQGEYVTGFDVSEPDEDGYVYLAAVSSNGNKEKIVKFSSPRVAAQATTEVFEEGIREFTVSGPDKDGYVYLTVGEGE